VLSEGVGHHRAHLENLGCVLTADHDVPGTVMFGTFQGKYNVSIKMLHTGTHGLLQNCGPNPAGNFFLI